MSSLDLTNVRFGRLVAIERMEPLKPRDGYRWLCQCDCGNTCIRKTRLLRYGDTVKSCGCYVADLNKQKPKARLSTNIKHGDLSRGRTREYSIWSSMIQRCTNKNHKNFKLYGGRGIAVCSEWMGSFEEFLSDMGRAPTTKHTIDRIDNNKGYSKGNCRWATYKKQANNRRNNIFITINSEVTSVVDAEKKYGIPQRTLYRWAKENKDQDLLFKIQERLHRR